MKISQAGIDLIKQFEGCKLAAYTDSVGIWTIGYGSTGKDVCQGLTITQEEAENRLRKHLEGVEAAINRLVSVPLTQHEFDALCSFVYNIGETAFGKSTCLRKLNDSDYDGAAAEILRWDKAGGAPVVGLTRRRQAEKALFESTI